MSKNKKSRHPMEGAPEPATRSRPAGLSSNRNFLIALFAVITLGGGSIAIMLRPAATVPTYKCRVLSEFPHDRGAFTQGLWIDPKDGTVYESTGKYGESTIRAVDLESGKVLRSEKLDEDLFGEGLAGVGDRLIQLTWKEEKALVWKQENGKFVLDREFPYQGNGWGLCYDGQHLIMSDGTYKLKFLDPRTFELVRSIDVFRGSRAAGHLNELEFIGGKIYANVWNQDYVYQIDPRSGKVLAQIDLSSLWPMRQRPAEGVFNGIAYNPKTDKMIVTGKYCPKMFEIELVAAESK